MGWGPVHPPRTRSPRTGLLYSHGLKPPTCQREACLRRRGTCAGKILRTGVCAAFAEAQPDDRPCSPRRQPGPPALADLSRRNEAGKTDPLGSVLTQADDDRGPRSIQGVRQGVSSANVRCMSMQRWTAFSGIAPRMSPSALIVLTDPSAPLATVTPHNLADLRLPASLLFGLHIKPALLLVR